jgi:hypothetical protein
MAAAQAPVLSSRTPAVLMVWPLLSFTSDACCRQQLASESAKAESAAAAAAEAAAVWQEVLMQTEEDLELQADRDGDRLAAARHEAGEVRSDMSQSSLCRTMLAACFGLVLNETACQRRACTQTTAQSSCTVRRWCHNAHMCWLCCCLVFARPTKLHI